MKDEYIAGIASEVLSDFLPFYAAFKSSEPFCLNVYISICEDNWIWVHSIREVDLPFVRQQLRWEFI